MQIFKFGLWLLIPTALLFSESLVEARRWLAGTLLILFFTTRVLWPTFPYLERPIYRMSSPLRASAAAGICSYPEKASSLNDLSAALERLGLQPGSELFVYSGTPPYYPIAGVYLLTRTVPLFLDPGVIEYPGARWPRHKQFLMERAAAGTLPKLVVRQKASFPQLVSGSLRSLQDVWSFNENAADSQFRWTSPQENYLAGEVDEILQNSGYQPVWENRHFVVLGKR